MNWTVQLVLGSIMYFIVRENSLSTIMGLSDQLATCAGNSLIVLKYSKMEIFFSVVASLQMSQLVAKFHEQSLDTPAIVHKRAQTSLKCLGQSVLMSEFLFSHHN